VRFSELGATTPQQLFFDPKGSLASNDSYPSGVQPHLIPVLSSFYHHTFPKQSLQWKPQRVWWFFIIP
jgi:hypothetical protein